jgi:hypothetical protein
VSTVYIRGGSRLSDIRRFNPDSQTPMYGVAMEDPTALVRKIVDQGLSVTQVVADRTFTSSADALSVMGLLSSAAVNAGLTNVVNELGEVQSAATAEWSLDDIPDVNPVQKEKVRFTTIIFQFHTYSCHRSLPVKSNM